MKDITGRKIKYGHILAVRYVWNSYVGVCGFTGLQAISPAQRFAFYSPHSFDASATYQILGHVKEGHEDYNEDVFKWYNSEEGDCPVKISIYENTKP